MRAANYVSAGDIRVDDTEARSPGRGEVRVRVAYVGLCGTDLHILHGDMDARVHPPQPFGHEMSGVVDTVGEDVEGWNPGDAVTVMPLKWDGTCPACRAGHEHICQHLEFIGVDSPGALQTLWTVPASTLVTLPDSLDLRTAALVEPVAVAVHDVRRSELATGDHAVVLGGGPIGVLIALVARDAGAEVLLVEPEAGRRERIAALGIDVLDPSAADPTAHVETWTGGAGADVVFEVSGAAAAVLSATSLAKVRGTVVVVAIHPTPKPVDLQRVFWRELRLLGARVYERRDFERAVDLLTRGAIPAAELVTHVRPLDEVTPAFDDLTGGTAMKVLVDVGGREVSA